MVLGMGTNKSISLKCTINYCTCNKKIESNLYFVSKIILLKKNIFASTPNSVVNQNFVGYCLQCLCLNLGK